MTNDINSDYHFFITELNMCLFINASHWRFKKITQQTNRLKLVNESHNWYNITPNWYSAHA